MGRCPSVPVCCFQPPSYQASRVDRGGDLSITYVSLAWLSPDAGRLCPRVAEATTSVPPTCHTSTARVQAPWYIRWQQDRRQFPDHTLPLARNSMKGQSSQPRVSAIDRGGESFS